MAVVAGSRRGRGCRCGFTLIELLVVVSIIALLVGILLPAIGETRRQARISVCASNMKQHGQGVANFASSNQDYLPHAPLSSARTPAEVSTYGPRGGIAFRFASREKPLNGFAFEGDGVRTMVSPNSTTLTLQDGERFKNLQGWNGYFIFLSEYMVDGEGVQALSDVFLSPSDTKARIEDWPRIRTTMRTRQGQWWNLEQSDSTEGLANPVTASYRYVPAAMTSHRLYSVSETGTPLTPDYNIHNGDGPAMSDDQRRRYVTRVPVASVDFPSNKVLFWLWSAHHNPKQSLWCEEGAVSPVAMADGGARATVATREALPWIPRGDRKRYEAAGPFTEIAVPQRDSSTVNQPAYYWLTNGGIKGRDL